VHAVVLGNKRESFDNTVNHLHLYRWKEYVIILLAVIYFILVCGIIIMKATNSGALQHLISSQQQAPSSAPSSHQIPMHISSSLGGGGTSSTTSTMDASPSSINSGHHSTHNAPLASFKMLLLIMMVLQNSATVLVGRYTRTAVRDKSELYDVNHLIVVIELGKLLLSAALEHYTTQGQLLPSLQRHIVQRPTDTLKVLIPALLYLVQNTLLYVALSNLTAPIFQVTYQAKLVTTALVSVFLLKRSYSIQQWVCLFILSLGVAIVVLGEQKETSGATTGGTNASSSRRVLLEAAKAAIGAQNLAIGLTAVSIACFSSALAGVYFEMVLKVPTVSESSGKQAPASLWMRNIQLSFFSIVIAVLQGMTKPASESNVGYLHGFTTWTWILVLLQAGGGLLVAAVIKYADNVLKGLATGVSVVFATVLSMVVFGTPLTNQFTVGATMILAAVYYFSNPLPKAITGTTIHADGSKDKMQQSKVETKSLLPK
jgi:solute carrier family 35 (UDP-sugar transporter), member A1/2/3